MIEILPLILLFIIYPVIVKMNVFPTPRGSLEYLAHPLGDANGDFYFYEKLKFLIPLAALSFLIFLLKKEKVKTKYSIGLAVYIIGITVSTLLSPFWSIAIKGGGNRYEGYYVLLSYGVLALAVLNISMKDIKKVRILIISLLAGGILVSITGITEFFGRSIYKIAFLSRWILPDEGIIDKVAYPSGGYVSLIEVIKGSPQFHNVSSSLGNSNYGGSFAALILGVLVVLFLENKKILKKIALLLAYGMLLILLLASRSRAGMVAFQGGMVLLLLIKIKEVKRYLPSVLILLILSGGVYYSMNYFSGGAIGAKFTDFEVAKKSEMRELLVEGSLLKLKMYGQDLYLKKNGDELRYLDTELKEIPAVKEGSVIKLQEKRYSKFTIEEDQRYSNLIYLVYEEERRYPIVLDGDTFKTVGREGIVEDIVNPERIKMVDKYQLKGSKRLYIWSRSVPLLKKSGLFGYGPDTYPIIYPQNDYFGKFISYGTPYMFISKPHNMYLQMAINTGILSLAGFLMVIFPYLYQSLKIHLSTEEVTEREIISLGIFIGIFSYLVAGLFNDSAVSIAPNFWMLLGLGIALNIFILEERKGRNIEKLKRRI